MNLTPFNIDFTIYSGHFQDWTGTDWVISKYKDLIKKTDEYNNELSIVDFDDDLIKLIVDDYINELNENDEEYIRIPFYGGFQIESGGKKIGYSCCGEFNNYINWKKILISKETDWTDIWIGHPWIFYKVTGGTIIFSNYTEKKEDIKELMYLDYEQFTLELAQWMERIEFFSGKILKYLEKIYPDKVDIYFKAMIESE